MHTVFFEELDDKVGVAASGLMGGALHEENHLVLLDPLFNDQPRVLLGYLVALALATFVALLLVAESEHQPSR